MAPNKTKSSLTLRRGSRGDKSLCLWLRSLYHTVASTLLAVWPCITSILLYLVLSIASLTLCDASSPKQHEETKTEEAIARSAIQSRYDNFCRSCSRKDLTGFYAFRTWDFRYYDYLGATGTDGGYTFMTRWELNRTKYRFDQCRDFHMKIKIIAFTLSGDNAVALVAQQYAATGPYKSPDPINYNVKDEITRDVWVKTNDGWLEQLQEERWVRVTNHGRVIVFYNYLTSPTH